MKLKMLHLAPLAPQSWGGPEFQSPPESGDLGGHREQVLYPDDLCISGSPSGEEFRVRGKLQASIWTWSIDISSTIFELKGNSLNPFMENSYILKNVQIIFSIFLSIVFQTA
jgi:hypothetical protein